MRLFEIGNDRPVTNVCEVLLSDCEDKPLNVVADCR